MTLAFWDVPERQWHPTLVLLPGKSHGQRSLVGFSPRGRWELDTTERLCFHFSLSCIGERNGNPLQWSCLENPRDGGAWWDAVSGVAQSRTQLKRLSNSSSLKLTFYYFSYIFSILKKLTYLKGPTYIEHLICCRHMGMITHLEPDILECEVKWALGSITTNKASGGDRIPAELFQILKYDAVKVLHPICQWIWKTQQ